MADRSTERTRARTRIENGASRYSVVVEGDGSRTLIDKQSEDRYVANGSRERIWREAIDLDLDAQAAVVARKGAI